MLDHGDETRSLVVPALAGLCAAASVAVGLVGCASSGPPGGIAEVWGEVNGQDVERFTIRNASGIELSAMELGATITALRVPDRAGEFADVVLGLDDPGAYLDRSPYFGCVAGRYANRIEDGQFELDGVVHRLTINNGNHHLHGGTRGFDKLSWAGSLVASAEGPAVRFELVSPDGDQGYPGELRVSVTYTLTDDNELITDFEASADAPTICNLAQHAYWNLGGHDSGTIEDHVLTIYSDRYTPVDSELIPTGELAPVDSTPFDFREGKPIGRDLRRAGGDPVGYDHNWVIRGDPRAMRRVLTLADPESGRVMEISSDQPGLQFYSGNFLDGTLVGKGGAAYPQYGGMCLETQTFPNSINEPAWPQPVLRPGETYRHRMVTRFTTDEGGS